MEVLLVDDSELVLELQKLMLEGYGLNVRTASSGAEAIAQVKEKEFSLVFMDIRMPEMDGFEAARRIREIDAEIPIIALSADEISHADERYVISGLNDSLVKPLEEAALRACLERYSVILPAGETKAPPRKDVLFDYDSLLSTLREEKAILTILQSFLGAHSQDCDHLSKFIEAKDYLSARAIIHNTVGISGNLYCRRLHNAAVLLGTELRQEKADSFPSFCRSWQLTLGALSECCNRLSAKYKPKEQTKDWSIVWNDFKELCEDFDIMALPMFMKNLKVFRANLAAEQFERLKKAVKDYDFLWIIDNMEGLDASRTVG